MEETEMSNHFNDIFCKAEISKWIGSVCARVCARTHTHIYKHTRVYIIVNEQSAPITYISQQKNSDHNMFLKVFYHELHLLNLLVPNFMNFGVECGYKTCITKNR